jgi:hypothetical protein
VGWGSGITPLPQPVPVTRPTCFTMPDSKARDLVQRPASHCDDLSPPMYRWQEFRDHSASDQEASSDSSNRFQRQARGTLYSRNGADPRTRPSWLPSNQRQRKGVWRHCAGAKAEFPRRGPGDRDRHWRPSNPRSIDTPDLGPMCATSTQCSPLGSVTSRVLNGGEGSQARQVRIPAGGTTVLDPRV